MSSSDISFNFAGSIVCTISWLIVPAPATGIRAVSVTFDPGATVDELEVKVTVAFVANTAPDRICSPPTTTMNASSSRHHRSHDFSTRQS